MSGNRPRRLMPPRNAPGRKRPKRVRMEERLAHEWEPLTHRELQSLGAVKDTAGAYEIDRRVLAKLIGERERLSYVAETARELLSECDRRGLERSPIDKVTPTALEKAMGATRLAIDAYDGDAARSSDC